MAMTHFAVGLTKVRKWKMKALASKKRGALRIGKHSRHKENRDGKHTNEWVVAQYIVTDK